MKKVKFTFFCYKKAAIALYKSSKIKNQEKNLFYKNII